MIKELVQYVKNECSSGLVIGTSLFAGFRPLDAADECVTIIEAGGPDSFYAPGLSSPLIWALVRSTNYMACRDLAYEIHAILHRMIGVELPVVDSGDNYLVNTSTALGRPSPLSGQDEKGRFEFGANYRMEVETY